MNDRVSPGTEVDAWCTKCKLDLNHRVIAMEGDRIARVECLTCRGHHNYRRPKSADPPPRAKRASKSRAKGGRTTRANAAAQQREAWEEAIMGKTPDDFTPYSIAATLQQGQLVRHKKFGDGVVAEVLEGAKVSVLFEAGPKTLIHGRQ